MPQGARTPPSKRPTLKGCGLSDWPIHIIQRSSPSSGALDPPPDNCSTSKAAGLPPDASLVNDAVDLPPNDSPSSGSVVLPPDPAI